MSYTNPELEKKIHELFNFKTDGFFVDIGAHNGLSLSNTKFLEDIGWDGICIEPHPNVFKQLIENRKCEKVNCALWNEDTKVNFLSLSGYTEMLSGIQESYDSRHHNRIMNELASYGGSSEIIEIDAKKFESVVSRKQIDFLSIDTEGSELQILERINFNEYDIKVICIENNFFEEKFNDFFRERGYRYHSNVFIDYLYVKN
jgi:FkbM family methyltransferase